MLFWRQVELILSNELFTFGCLPPIPFLKQLLDKQIVIARADPKLEVLLRLNNHIVLLIQNSVKFLQNGKISRMHKLRRPYLAKVYQAALRFGHRYPEILEQGVNLWLLIPILFLEKHVLCFIHSSNQLIQCVLFQMCIGL